jgi:hypothetical protein
MIKVPTIKDQFAVVETRADFDLSVRDYLDRFRSAPAHHLLEEEPASLTHQLADGGVADAYLASVAASLAHEQKWPAPQWAAGTSRALEQPFFAAKTPKLRAIYLQESPVEFRLKHLFVSANVLSRA